MIYLHRTQNSALADKIESELKRLVVAYKVVDHDENRNFEALPAIMENGKTVTGEKPILLFLKELKHFASEWRKFQTDACYIDEDGNVC